MAEVFRGSEDTIDCCFCSIDKKKLAEPTQSVSNDKSFRVNSEGNTSPVSFNTSATCVRQLCTRFRTFTPSPPSSSISRASQTFAISIRTIIDPLYPIFPPPDLPRPPHRHVRSMARRMAIVKIVWNFVPFDCLPRSRYQSPLSAPARNQSNDLTREGQRASPERVTTFFHSRSKIYPPCLMEVGGGAIINSSTRRDC